MDAYLWYKNILLTHGLVGIKNIIPVNEVLHIIKYLIKISKTEIVRNKNMRLLLTHILFIFV